ncbi:MAG: hypothetical protein AAF483_16895 [Planctomycetota bacterium]
MFQRKKTIDVDRLSSSLIQELPRALGDQLLALIQYFPARVSSTQSEPDRIHLLILLDTMNMEVLSACADAINRLAGKEALSPMILSRDELLGSTDVFPITFLEMQAKYKVLAGEDFLANLTVSDAHLRLRCEQELRNLLLRMQRTFILRKDSPRTLLDALRQCNATLGRCMLAIEKLTVAFDGDHAASEAMNQDLQLDIDLVKRIQELSEAKSAVGSVAVAEVFGALLTEVHRICAVVDRLGNEQALELDGSE